MYGKCQKSVCRAIRLSDGVFAYKKVVFGDEYSSRQLLNEKQVISVREKTLSGCYRRNAHGPLLSVKMKNKNDANRLGFGACLPFCVNVFS